MRDYLSRSDGKLETSLPGAPRPNVTVEEGSSLGGFRAKPNAPNHHSCDLGSPTVACDLGRRTAERQGGSPMGAGAKNLPHFAVALETLSAAGRKIPLAWAVLETLSRPLSSWMTAV
jgi:hypothetical protein